MMCQERHSQLINNQAKIMILASLKPPNKQPCHPPFSPSSIIYPPIKMAFLQDKLLIFVLLIFCATTSLSARPRNRRYTPPSVPHLTDLFPHVSISNGFSNIFGAKNFQLTGNGSMAALALDKSSGKYSRTNLHLIIYLFILL